MTIRNFAQSLAGATCVAAIAASGSAYAQAAAAPAAPRPAAAAPAAAPIQSGPAIPGVCVFSSEGAIGGSAVGKYVGTRLQQLQSQVQAEVQGEATALQTEEKTYAAQRATLTTEVQQQRELGFSQRETALQRKAEVRGRELEATQQKALGRVVTEFNPLLRQVYTQRNCSLLLDRNAVLGSNPSMDITADVVKLLDAKITTFQFDRERLDQQQAAAGARPAAAAAAPAAAPATRRQ